jgi:HSP20 family protein
LDGALLAEVEASDSRTIPVIQKIKMEDRRMALLLARPFRDLQRMAQRWESPFTRLFEEFEDNYDEVFTPAIESYVKDGNIVVRADVPGLELKDLEVTILGNVLSVKGERKDEQEVKKDDYLRREISYGAFERRMSLPEGAAIDKVKASFKNGVIEITVPLAKETVATKVPIEAEAEKKVEISKH